MPVFKHAGPAVCAALILMSPIVAARASDDEGASLFRRKCITCHSLDAGRNGIGPSLAGVYGRKVGQAPNYRYSSPLQNSPLTWNDATLSQYLTNPRSFFPGSKSAMIGVNDPADVRLLLGYLKQQAVGR